MTAKHGQIEVAASYKGFAARGRSGDSMAGTGKNNEPPGKEANKSSKSPPKPVADDDDEDGDIATPKRDRDGEDDQPL